VRGRLGRKFIVQPLTRCSTKRRRHLPTVGMLQRRRWAIVPLLSPRAAHNTNLARATIACGNERDAARADNRACFSALTTSSAVSRPIAIGISP
jgi:hypothetical protein